MQKLVRIFAILVFVALGGFIFFLVVTGRGETTPPAEIGGYPVRGADLSSHNGDVDFNALKDAGISFVFLKATEGSGFKDSRFDSNYGAARRAGLKTGAYHFFRFDQPGYMQALNIMHSLRGKRLDLPVAIDVEEWTNPSNHHTDRIVGQIRQMRSTLEANGYRCMIYTNKDGYARFVRNHLEDMPLWLCSFTDIDNDINWTFWQYSHRGLIKGVDRLVDMNVFRGDSAAWDSLTACATPAQ